MLPLQYIHLIIQPVVFGCVGFAPSFSPSLISYCWNNVDSLQTKNMGILLAKIPHLESRDVYKGSNRSYAAINPLHVGAISDARATNDWMTLKRLFPLKNQIDYMLIEGREWVGDSDRRYTAVDMNEALITGIPRLNSQIMNDIPQVFALDEHQFQRKDNPIIPRKVVREALVNALMHKDYRVPSPTQIIKYANRIEFRNIGYSLKPQDQLGLPGSVPRNEILTHVFRDIQYAESKGTGIRTMCEEMKKANLSIPFFESNRIGNFFVLTLLPHHLFNQRDIEWLASFKNLNLTGEEARTLIIVREKGSISNAEYRALHGVDTLSASTHLRRLRDLEFLEQQGSGNKTYYVPTQKSRPPAQSTQPPLIPLQSSATFPTLPEDLYSNKMNLWFLTASGLPHIFCLHFGSCL